MTRIQATSIITSLLIAVEQAGYTKHHVITFGHTFAEITIFSEYGSESLDKVEEFLQPLIPEGVNTFREHLSDGDIEYIDYNIAFD